MFNLLLLKSSILLLLFWKSDASSPQLEDLIFRSNGVARTPSQLDKPSINFNNPSANNEQRPEVSDPADNMEYYSDTWDKIKDNDMMASDDDLDNDSRTYSEESMGKRSTDELIMKRSMAMGRTSLRPGKRSVEYDSSFRPSKRSVAVGRAFFRPGKRSDLSDDYESRTKKTVAVGRASFRPGKRSTAVGRWNFRPGKRSAAVGRIYFRPGKRFDMSSM